MVPPSPTLIRRKRPRSLLPRLGKMPTTKMVSVQLLSQSTCRNPLMVKHQLQSQVRPSQKRITGRPPLAIFQSMKQVRRLPIQWWKMKLRNTPPPFQVTRLMVSPSPIPTQRRPPKSLLPRLGRTPATKMVSVQLLSQSTCRNPLMAKHQPQSQVQPSQKRITGRPPLAIFQPMKQVRRLPIQ